MGKIKENKIREKRIYDEIIVDCYDESERAMGWYYYLEGKINFPFKAKCIIAKRISPLKKGEEVEVTGMLPEEYCEKEMFVEIKFAGRKLGVPLSQLEGIKVDKETKGAISDWRYWVDMEYQF